MYFDESFLKLESMSCVTNLFFISFHLAGVFKTIEELYSVKLGKINLSQMFMSKIIGSEVSPAFQKIRPKNLPLFCLVCFEHLFFTPRTSNTFPEPFKI